MNNEAVLTLNGDETQNEITFHLEVFEGPLELLLSLIAKNKVDIYDIPIALIFEQYMDYIHSMEMFNMEIASSFIVMAAQLMLIKSRLLLPKQQDQEDPRQELVDVLVEYQKAKLTSEVLHERELTFSGTYEKPPEKIQQEPEYTLKHDISLLTDAFMRVYTRMSALSETQLEADQSIDKLMTATRRVSVNEKIVHVLKRLVKNKKCSMINLFENVKSRNETVATFMAILELLKGKRLRVVSQNEDFSVCELELIREKV